jgi:short subunit dehydrogenase-like uncharacterized protein
MSRFAHPQSSKAASQQIFQASILRICVIFGFPNRFMYMSARVLIYGCYGYTGELIVEEAQALEVPVLLSGRNADRVKALAERHGLPWTACDLADAAGLDALLARVDVVLHCAGPYVHTYAPMLAACLRNGKHYLDITGEIGVFEAIAARNAEAKTANVMLMPGVGFDVVPTDCLAARLKADLPDAESLHIAILNIGARMSHGTAKTMVENLGSANLVRRAGKIVERPMAQDSIEADFGRGPKTAYALPWGDVSTAFYTTGIPNITTYFALPKGQARFLRFSKYIGWLLRMDWVRRIARKRIEKQPAGPSSEQRLHSATLLWGKAVNAQGKSVTATLETPNGYAFTAVAAVHIAHRVLQGDWKPGFQTPAGCYGLDLFEAIMAGE